MRPRSLPALFAAAWFATAATAPANEVWIVDSIGSSGADFQQVQDAVDAAADGDILITRSNTHHGTVVIDGKSLTLVRQFSDAGYSSIKIRNIAAHQRVVLRGIGVGSVGSLHYGLIEVRDCDGPVFLEDVKAFLDVHDCAKVVVSRSHLRGFDVASTPHPNPPPPGAGLYVDGSFVALYETSIDGGRGVYAGVPPFMSIVTPSTPGMPAIQLDSGTVFLGGCTVRGGFSGGGFFDGTSCLPESDGVPGIVSNGALVVLDSEILPGPAGPPASAGFPPVPICPPVGVTPGPIESTANAAFHEIDDAARTLTVSAPTTPGLTTTFELRGQPNEQALLLVSAVPFGAPGFHLRGVLGPGVPLNIIALGALPADGRLFFTVPGVPHFPPGVDGAEVWFQGVVAGAANTGLLTNPSIAVYGVP